MNSGERTVPPGRLVVVEDPSPSGGTHVAQGAADDSTCPTRPRVENRGAGARVRPEPQHREPTRQRRWTAEMPCATVPPISLPTSSRILMSLLKRSASRSFQLSAKFVSAISNSTCLGEDPNGRPIIIENQLEATDHNHLGQLIVYASGLEAAVVVWLTPRFRDEHRRALDWLNERTDENVYFLGWSWIW